MFERAYELLKKDGYFIIIDACTNSNKKVTNWYYKIWKEWIIRFQKNLKLKEKYENIVDTAPKKPENHYKFGVFTMFGGRK